MIAVWPDTLPRPERKTWGLTPQDARRKHSPQSGSPIYKRRFSKAAKLVTLSVVLDRNQRAVFDNFFHDTCEGGSLYFWMPDPTTDGWPLLTSEGAPLLTETGAPLLLSAQWLCAWGDSAPAESIEGQVEFRKTFSIVVVPS